MVTTFDKEYLELREKLIGFDENYYLVTIQTGTYIQKDKTKVLFDLSEGDIDLIIDNVKKLNGEELERELLFLMDNCTAFIFKIEKLKTFVKSYKEILLKFV